MATILVLLIGMFAMVVAAALLERLCGDEPPDWLDRLLF